MKDLMVYLKTTDTCQLHCDHCFTNGTNGKKGFFDVDKTADFFRRLKAYNPHFDSANMSFHGGEPFLCPTNMMFDFHNQVKDLWINMWWSIQTNLTFPLTDDKVDVLDKICNKAFGTSWDKDIRWRGNDKQERVWEQNVKALADAGHIITVMISMNRGVIDMEPIEVINKMAALGIKHISFERITLNGNARFNPSIMPYNVELDAWFMKMFEQCKQHKTYEYIDNTFFDSIMTQIVHNTHAGCRCRQCEQKIFTINADGSIGGCPNGAVEKQFGHISDDIHTLLTSEGRICNITAETIRNPICATCPVYDICNGDCHQLNWQGDICAAPKTLMQHLKQEKDVDTYKLFLNGFMGQE